MPLLSTQLIQWLDEHADSLDQSDLYADVLLHQLAQDNIFKSGVPTEFGGDGGTIEQTIRLIQAVAEHSLTAAFVAWGHRTLIENLLASENQAAKEKWLAALISGEIAGSTGLSNATKFLSGVEELQVSITEQEGKRYLNGYLPWLTNLRAERFVVVFAAEYVDVDKKPIVIAVPSEALGLTRSENLSLVALQGSNTAALRFENVELAPDWILSDNAETYLAKIRPEFLGLQCGMAFGLAQRSLSEVEKTLGSNRAVLKTEWETQKVALADLQQRLFNGLATGAFRQNPKAIFQIRIDVVELVAQSLLLELQAGGGRAYLENTGFSFIRRWREGAFLPIVTPSAVQLRLVLSQS
ncbi:acyl-CoA dehydrogenase family protein [Rodentibacter haemolyticus]|uniref:Acyl-CoA/acyl-ACP dehydrogenase n=1 Tax=Rodentibacter haemolyticus TaxID=2778911 RepID=A0ABX6UXG5_9PAST|nr:acyl-CoA dehydrogenase family protein [Rodentibacter haemolyticus]QPB42469.1 acyl-CoA/acyl-ACP dehydrogenase [Rodentibacter haemolyticus]